MTQKFFDGLIPAVEVGKHSMVIFVPALMAVNFLDEQYRDFVKKLRAKGYDVMVVADEKDEMIQSVAKTVFTEKIHLTSLQWSVSNKYDSGSNIPTSEQTPIYFFSSADIVKVLRDLLGTEKVDYVSAGGFYIYYLIDDILLNLVVIQPDQMVNMD